MNSQEVRCAFAEVLSLVLLIAASSTADAGVASFDFEKLPGRLLPGSLFRTNSGLTLTITPEGDPAGFVIVGVRTGRPVASQSTGSLFGEVSAA